MASRCVSRALRSSAARQLTAAPAQRRTFVSALGGVRTGAAVSSRLSIAGPTQQVRGVKTIDFAGSKEKVFGRSILGA